MQQGQPRSSPDETRRSSLAPAAWLAAAGWTWALSLLATREHHILDYHVVESAPPLWGFVALPVWKLLAILLAGTAWARACSRAESPLKKGRGSAADCIRPHTRPRFVAVPVSFFSRILGRLEEGGARQAMRWLFAAYLIPAGDAFRAAGIPLAFTFFEPLWLTWISGAAIVALAGRGGEEMGPPPGQCNTHTGNPARRAQPVPSSFPSRRRQQPQETARRLPAGLLDALVWLLALAVGAWWYNQSCTALDAFLLGYHDFGHFAFRVASTWKGRGFLLETPGLPAFWDHFNPGLALLAPLWGLWPDARLFLLLQAVCLALPAPLVFRIARLWGMTASAAAVWAAAYLAFPAVGQLNLNYSYGWHPISLALPWIFAALAALLARRFWWAAACALLACSFEEAVIVALACLAVALGLQAWWSARRREPANHEASDDSALARRLPIGAWWGIWVLLTFAFMLIAHYAAFTRYQTGRFENLGESGLAIALSPFLRPRVFWGEALGLKSLLFLVTLLLPLTPGVLVRGRWLLLAAAFPLGLLMGWGHPPAKSIAFQYVTTLLPLLWLAALAGARRLTAARSLPVSQPAAERASRSSADLSLGLAALVSCLVASSLFGALPWSSPTLSIMLAQTYQTEGVTTLENPRAPGTAANQFLREITTQINSEKASVLASGRIAAHLLNVHRLETVEQALFRWQALQAEAGEGRSGVEVFDWIVLDTCERFQQSLDKMEAILVEAQRVGYRSVRSQDGILLLERPPSGALSKPQPSS